MVATIFSLITIGLVAFLVNSSYGMFWASNKALITNDVRNFTTRITNETIDARWGYIYPSFAASDRDSVSDRRASGETGDCLVLIFHDPYPDIDDAAHYTRLIVFFRRPDSEGISPVYRAEKILETPVEINFSGSHSSFESFLAEEFPNDLGDYPVVLELSRGLANGQLFRRFGEDAFIINGEILHGNEVKEVTNTYNLTISTRG
jgi:hypothetical protein